MPGVTLNQIAIRIASEQGDHSADDGFISQCETWLKDAMIEIDSAGEFKIFAKTFSITTDSSNTTGLYDLPEDFRSMKYIRHIDIDSEIDYINPKALVQYGIDLEQRGTARNHWVTDPRVNIQNQFIQRVRFHPIPNNVETLDGMYYFDVINVGSDDIIPMSQRAILAIESRLRMYITKADKEWTAYNVERSEYNINLANLLREEKSKPSRNLKARTTDLPSKSRRPTRLRYPFE